MISDFKIKEVELEGKAFAVEMRVREDDIKKVYFVFDRLPIIKSREKLLETLEDIFSDVLALKNEILYGHMFDDLPEEEPSEWRIF